MRKTDILDVVGRKLAPYMFLFGLYLVTFGDSSPGGGFQGGVVIASGIILLAMTRGSSLAEELFPLRTLSAVESAGFLLFLAAGIVGMVVGGSFLADFTQSHAEIALLPRARHIYWLNLIIGVKVGSGASLICLTLFRESR